MLARSPFIRKKLIGLVQKEEEMKLNEMKESMMGTISAIHGADEFQRRITAVGLALHNPITMVQNDKKTPVMLYVRNTMLAVNRQDCELIEVEVMVDGN